MKPNNKLKPCVIFDLDDTLFHTPNINWAKPTGKCEEKLMKAKPIIPNVFLYHAVDYMINDPPEYIDDNNRDWPREIFFCTARPEYYRESTVHSLCELTQDSGTSISKRLIMRPQNSDKDLSHKEIKTTFEAKKFAYQKVKERGYRAVLAFDNDYSAVKAYLDGGAEVMHKVFASNYDKENWFDLDK